MKITVKQLAAGTLIALLLLVGNANAEGTEKITNSQAIETSLQLEPWMIDQSIWNSTKPANFEITQETETGLELENWMTSSKTWRFENNFAEETESKMEIENWMTSEEIWNK